MKNLLLRLTVFCVTFLVSIHISSAANVMNTLNFNSAYVWRGITFNDGFVAQPSIDVSLNGFGVNVWANMDIDDYNNTLEEDEFSEIDITLRYGLDLKPLSINFGCIQYLFPAGAHGTRELYLSVGMNPVENLTTTFNLNYDFDQVDDFYSNVSIAYNIEVMSKLNAGITASGGYAGNDASLGTDGGLNDYQLSISSTYSATDSLSFSFFVAYTGNFDDKVLPDQDVDWFGGIGINYSM
ncbi:MAG: MltA-interacting MipA family protein [Desulfobacterales bacterium]|nr:MltA-interacting MipA family protein [Desulfobacterales bacterium]